MKIDIILILVLLQSHYTYAYNLSWLTKDRKLIKEVLSADRNYPNCIEKIFQRHRCDKQRENLGFGWTIWAPSIGAGYIGISARFYYFHDTAISYVLIPELPKESALACKYASWYGNRFSISDNLIYSDNFNLEKVGNTLSEYMESTNPIAIPAKLKYFISPESGIDYAINGNRGAKMPKIRMDFSKIRDSLSAEETILLMYSINPASRFLAIENYFNHRAEFSDTSKINKWVERNFIEIPIIKVQMSCTYENYWESKTLIEMYLAIEDKMQ